MPKRRDTTQELIRMKKAIIEKCLRKEMRCVDGAKELDMHPKAFLRLKRRYAEQGREVLWPKKPGPKQFEPSNKTPSWIEDLVVQLAQSNRHLGPQPLSEKLWDERRILVEKTTVWRILKRRKVRYFHEYIPIPRKKPKLYCLEKPCQEVQLDGCFPAGRSRKLVALEAVDDCSRWSFGRYYERETVDNALLFVRKLQNRTPFPIENIRVDNRYKKRFKQECERRYGISVIVNDPYEPKQNGKVERFHQTMKHEFFWRKGLYKKNIEEINYHYGLWLKNYNEQRRHGGLRHEPHDPERQGETCHAPTPRQHLSNLSTKGNLHPATAHYLFYSLLPYLFCHNFLSPHRFHRLWKITPSP